MLTTIVIISVLLLAGFGMYTDNPKHLAGRCPAVDETPLEPTPAEEEPQFNDSLAREHGSVMEASRDDSILDPDVN